MHETKKSCVLAFRIHAGNKPYFSSISVKLSALETFCCLRLLGCCASDNMCRCFLIFSVSFSYRILCVESIYFHVFETFPSCFLNIFATGLISCCCPSSSSHAVPNNSVRCVLLMCTTSHFSVRVCASRFDLLWYCIQRRLANGHRSCVLVRRLSVGSDGNIWAETCGGSCSAPKRTHQRRVDAVFFY